MEKLNTISKIRFLKVLKENEYTLNVTKLVSGTLTGNIIILISMPILSRIYSPVDFGTFQQFISFSSIFLIFGTLSFHSAILLPDSDKEVRALTLISFIVLMIITIIILSFISLLPTSMFDFLNAEEVIQHNYFIPLIVFWTGLQLILENLMLQQKRFMKLSIFRVIRTLLSQVGALLLSIIFLNFLGLLISYICSFIIVTICILIYLKFYLRFKDLSFERIRATIRKYKKFPLVDTPSMFINTISNEMPIYLLTLFHAPEKIGLYAVAFRLLRAPISILGTSFGEAYFQKGSEIFNRSKEDLTPFFLATLKKLTAIAGLLCLVVFFFSNMLVELYLGPHWIEVATIMKILMVWLFFEFLYNPVSTSFLITKRLEVLFALNLSLLVFRTGSMYFFRSSAMQLILALSVTSAVFYIIYILSALFVVKKESYA